MAKVTNKFWVSIAESIAWMSAINLRSYQFHAHGADKDKPFGPFEKCIGLRYAAAVVMLRDNVSTGLIKQKQAEEILRRLDAAFKDYISDLSGLPCVEKEALDKLDEINKEIPLVF